jgi:pre-mRNA-splicing factor SYF1
MLRIKRSVQAQYNTDVGYVAASAQAGAPLESNGTMDERDPMAALERSAPLAGFVESSTGPVGGGTQKEEKEDTPVENETSMDNPNAIDLGDDDDDETR